MQWALSPEALAFQKYASDFGLEATDLHREFKSGDKTFRITGHKLGRSSYPILAESVANGKGYKFAVDIVQFALGRHPRQVTAAASRS